MNPNQKNADLRGACEAAGFTRVASIQSSGNLVFDADNTNRDQESWTFHLGATERGVEEGDNEPSDDDATYQR